MPFDFNELGWESPSLKAADHNSHSFLEVKAASILQKNHYGCPDLRFFLHGRLSVGRIFALSARFHKGLFL